MKKFIGSNSVFRFSIVLVLFSLIIISLMPSAVYSQSGSTCDTSDSSESENIAMVKSFFQSVKDKSILNGADSFFTQGARYIFIRGGEERFGKGDENGPESLLSSTQTAFSDSKGGLPLKGFDFLTGQVYDVKIVPVVGGYQTAETQANTGAYSEVSFSHERQDLIPFSGEYIGPEGVVDFFQKFFNNYDILSFISTKDEYLAEKGEPSPNPYGFIAQCSNVAVFGELVFKNKYTGNNASSPFRIDIEFKGGKINVYQIWMDVHSLAASARQGGSWRGQYSLEVPANIPEEPLPFPWPDNYTIDPLFGRKDNSPYVHNPLYIQWGTGSNDSLSGFANANRYYDPTLPDDQLYGLQGNDTLIGLEGDDELLGGSGNDDLNGGAGNDTLNGNTGLNSLEGGSGSDIFVVDNLFDLTSEVTTSTIEDFSSVEGDTIGLGGTITFDQLIINDSANGAEISIKDSGLPPLAIVNNVSAAQLTEDKFQLIRPSYNVGVTTPDDVIGDAEENISLALGFFQSFFTGDIFKYIEDNFTENARYIVIQGVNNEYTADDAFSAERYKITPSTTEWTGIDGAQAFIKTLFEAVDILGTRYPDMPTVTNFYIEKMFTDITDPDNIAISGRFMYRMNSTGLLTDVPFAYNFQVKHVVDTQTGKVVPKLDHFSFFEEYTSFGYAARQGGDWVRNYNGELTHIFWGTKEAETISGSDINDIIYGYQSNDTISGGEGDDTISGGEGDDTITGSKGNDSVSGNNGNDTFVLASGDGIDTIEDFEKGIDKIKLSDNLSFNDLTFTTTNSVEISVTATGEVLAVVKGVEQLDSDDFIFIDDKKAKFTFYLQEDVTGKDSLSIAGSMKPKLIELPFNNDVTVAVSVVDGQNNKHKLFTQLVPDGTVEGTKKYYLKSKESGIEKLQFKQRKDSTDFKVSVDMVDFLSVVRSEMSSDEYLTFVRDINSYIITIDIDGEAWSGSASLKPGGGNKKKQMLKSHR